MTDFAPLVPLALPLKGSCLIEASAGTGKTWTLAALYVRLVLGQGDTAFPAGLAPKQILVLTFTRAATRELRERIRARLAQTAELLRQARDCLNAHGEDALHTWIAQIPDAFLRELLLNCEQLDASYARCNKAAQDMDQAAIYTINSFCQRALKRFAFAAGHAFEQQVQTDTSLLDEAVRNDYWRCFMQPLPACLLHELAQHKVKGGLSNSPLATPTVLGKAINAHKIKAAKPPEQRPFPAAILAHEQVLAQLAAAKETARATLAEQWPLFSDWLGAQLEQEHLSKGSYQENPFRSLRDFIDSGNIKTSDLVKFTEAGFKWNKKKPYPLPATLTAPHTLAAFLELQASSNAFPLELLLQHAADWMAVEKDKRLDAQSSITFDTMVTHLAQALDAAGGATLADQLFAAYPCALIDEFQDTDQNQYRIFQKIYQQRAPDTHAWLMIGDPKQSIYRFRGADINTYLAASHAANSRYTLGTNFRSSAALVDACNHLFAHSPLAQDDAALGVFGSDTIRYRAVSANGSGEQLLLNGKPATPLTLFCAPLATRLAASVAEPLLAEQFAARIAQLLQQSQAGEALLRHQDSGHTRALQPSDIACLVRQGNQAELLKSALTAQGVDAVFLSDKSSVFASETAVDVVRLLNAVANPADGRLARQALACALMAYDSDALVTQLQQDEHWLAHLQRLRALHDVWQHQGVLPMLYRLVHLSELPERQRDERVLTDFFHLAELLQQASNKLDGMEALIAWLQAAIHGKPGDTDASDSSQNERQLRLENERNRVIIMTLHGAKGLEFPLVMLPFASIVASENKRDDANEDMRLLYVGITRAVHACWLGLAPARSGSGKEHQLEHNALGRLLFGNAHLEADAMTATLASLVENAAGQIQLDNDELTQALIYQPDNEGQRLSLPTLTPPRPPQHWSVTSYSRLASGATRSQFNAASERLLESSDADSDPGSAPTSLHQFARGREAGNLLHSLLEKLCLRGFARLHDNAIAELLEQYCQAEQWQASKPLLADWLARIIHTPLPLGDTTCALAEVDMCLAESEFWLRLQHTPMAALDRLTHQLLPGARAPLNAAQLNGMLKGFIDLLLCVNGRYYVLDYKSNYLGADANAYTQEAMHDAMLAHRYELQGLLYQLALHRLLRARLPDYDPATHLGGSLFFFLRGIDSDTRGICHLPARPDLLDELDALFTDATAGVRA